MEFFTGLFVGLAVWEIGLIIVALVVSGISLKQESGLFFAIPLIAVGIGLFNIELNWITGALYIVLGLVTMVLKFRGHVSDVIRKYIGKEKTKKEMISIVFRDINADVIFFWFVAWPYVATVYFFTRFLADLWTAFWEATKAAAKAFYNKVKYFLQNIVDNMLTKAGFKD